jgi:hypothetical protein
MSTAAFITGRLQSIAKRKRAAPRKKKPIAQAALTPYNAEQRGKYPQESRLDALARHLIPLRSGRSVVLSMELPKPKAIKVTKFPPKLVVIAPGPVHGFKKGFLLISIVGMGAALVKLHDPSAVAKLVLARMPVRLARELMNRIHQVFEER